MNFSDSSMSVNSAFCQPSLHSYKSYCKIQQTIKYLLINSKSNIEDQTYTAIKFSVLCSQIHVFLTIIWTQISCNKLNKLQLFKLQIRYIHLCACVSGTVTTWECSVLLLIQTKNIQPWNYTVLRTHLNH